MTEFDAQLDTRLRAIVATAGSAEPDWDDVLARADIGTISRRPRRTRLVALAAAIVALILAAPVFGLDQELWGLITRGNDVHQSRLSRRDLFTLSRVGSTVPLGRIASPALRHSEVSGVRRLAAREGRAFYAVDLKNGRTCYGTGASDEASKLGLMVCPGGLTAFPSAAEPVFDLSVYEAGDPAGPRVVRLAGFAANAVKAVALQRPDGQIVLRAPVVDNVYVATEGLPESRVRALVALGSHDRPLATICLVQGGC
jgi:hypothetical protein